MVQRIATSLLLACSLSAQSVGQGIDRIAAEQQFSGSVLIARAGKVLHSKGYGQANRSWSIDNSPSTRFPIASITKSFTALAILQMVEQGRCRLDDRITKYFPEAPTSWAEITLEHLLRHRSGIPSHRSLTEYKKTITQPYTPAELIAEYFGAPLSFPAGTKFEYSNPGYHLLGILLERLSGDKRSDYLQKHVFEPAGMTDSGIERFEDVIPNLADGYAREDGRIVRARYWDRSIAFATGDVYSTTGDMMRYVLGRSSQNGVRYYEHTGGNPGFASITRTYPESKLLIVILANFEGDRHDQPR